MKTALLVVNPAAGAGQAPARAEELARELDAVGVSARIVLTPPAPDEILPAQLSRSDVAIAVGGDGTLNRVAEAILRMHDEADRPALGFLACGTGNAAVRAFHLPRRPIDIAALTSSAATRTIDVGIAVHGSGGQLRRGFVSTVRSGCQSTPTVNRSEPCPSRSA